MAVAHVDDMTMNRLLSSIAHNLKQPRERRFSAEAKTTSSSCLISAGALEPLTAVACHGNGDAPLLRRVLFGSAVHPRAGVRMVVHEIHRVSSARRSYCEPHVHPCDELNVLLSDEQLVYAIGLGDEVFEVSAPASIYIPKGVVHSANVVAGSGFYLAFQGSAAYDASSRPGAGTR
jgi:hypothetical protein